MLIKGNERYPVKFVTVFAAFALLLSSCGHNNIKKLLEHHYKALNRHDVNALAQDYDSKVQITSSGWQGIHNGIAQLKTDWLRYFRSTPAIRFDIGKVYYAADSVAVIEYTFAGALSSPEPGEPAYMVGKKYMLNACTIFTIRQDKIVKETTYFDQVSFLRQVGFFDQH